MLVLRTIISRFLRDYWTFRLFKLIRLSLSLIILGSSCTYYKYGCSDVEASNYDESAERDDGSCTYYKYGCTDSKALNWDIEANEDDGSCKYVTATFDEEKLDDKEIIGDNGDNDDSSGGTFLGLLVLGASGYGVYKLVKNIKN